MAQDLTLTGTMTVMDLAVGKTLEVVVQEIYQEMEMEKVVVLFEALPGMGSQEADGTGKGIYFTHLLRVDGDGFGDSDYQQVKPKTGYGDGDLAFRIRG